MLRAGFMLRTLAEFEFRGFNTELNSFSFVFSHDENTDHVELQQWPLERMLDLHQLKTVGFD